MLGWNQFLLLLLCVKLVIIHRFVETVDKIVDNVVEEMGMTMTKSDKTGHATRLETKRWVVDDRVPRLVDHPAVQEAARRLREGEVVAFPTETVYGLGANCFSPAAVQRIFAAKGRPSDNPLIVHIADEAWLNDLVRVVPETARRLMTAFWPGPLTLIFPSNGRVAPEVTAGLSTVAVRMPDHPVALALLMACGVPLAAPSANRSGRPSPTRAEHVLDDLDGRIAGVLDGGPVPIGTESTVVDVSGSRPVVLRPGAISRQALEEVLQQPVLVASHSTETKEAAVENRSGPEGPQPPDAAPVESESVRGAGGYASDVPRSPGMKYTHYAPRGQLWLVDGSPQAMCERIVREALEQLARGKRVGILTTEEHAARYQQALSGRPVVILPCGRRRDLATVARELYGCLRRFDDEAVEVIFAEAVPPVGIGEAVMNRLEKASGGRRLRV